MRKKQVLFNANLDGLDKKPEWYTIVTLYNYEDMVANKINEMSMMDEYKDFIIEAFPGVQKVKEHYINKKGEYCTKIKSKKILSNYCFVKCYITPEIWNTLTNITGFGSIICISGRPVSTSESEINKVKDMMKSIEVILGTEKEQDKIIKILGKEYVANYIY